MVVAIDSDDGGGDVVMKEEMVKWRGDGVPWRLLKVVVVFGVGCGDVAAVEVRRYGGGGDDRGGVRVAVAVAEMVVVVWCGVGGEEKGGKGVGCGDSRSGVGGWWRPKVGRRWVTASKVGRGEERGLGL
ncbi:hypothetical protein Tco_1506157 [Tanacetum coccineum]